MKAGMSIRTTIYSLFDGTKMRQKFDTR